MEGQVILALALAIPVILFPAAFVWYLQIGGIYAALRKTRKTAHTAKQPVGAR